MVSVVLGVACPLIVIAFLVLIGASAIRHVLIRMVMRFRGCNKEEAESVISNWINRNQNSICLDERLSLEIREIVKALIGEQRYNDLEKAACIGIPWITCGMAKNLPCVAVVLYISNENERVKLQTAIGECIKSYLPYYEYPEEIVTEWERDATKSADVLIIYFSRNDEEHKRLTILKSEIVAKTATKYSDITEEVENE